MVDMRTIAPDQLRPLLRVEYERLVDLGVFDEERVELLNGVLLTMSPQGTKHAECVRRLSKILFTALSDRATVQIQTPLGAGRRSLPEPDLAVVPLGNYKDAHPEGALWVIEVANSSLDRDRAKAALYAVANVAEYWIVNLVDGVVEVHSDAHGERYRTITTHDTSTDLAPGAFEDLIIRVGDVLP